MNEETQDHTYAYETDPDSEQLVKVKRQELKTLREKAAKDRRYRLVRAAQKRAMRDDKIDRINLKLKSIKEQMVYYNRAGKVEKDGIDVLRAIYNLIKNDVDLAEEIERTTPTITDEEIEAEVVDESEISPPGN